MIFGSISNFLIPFDYLFQDERYFIELMSGDFLITIACMSVISIFIVNDNENTAVNDLWITCWVFTGFPLCICCRILSQLDSFWLCEHHKNLSLAEIGYNYEYFYFSGISTLYELKMDQHIRKDLKMAKRDIQRRKTALVIGYNSETYDSCKIFQALIQSNNNSYHVYSKGNNNNNIDLEIFENKVLLINGYINQEIKIKSKLTNYDYYIPMELIEMIAMFYFPGLICCNVGSKPKEGWFEMKKNKFHFVHINHDILTNKIMSNWYDFTYYLSVVFCVSLPSFCEYEEDGENMMRLNLNFFEDIVNHEELNNVSIMLILCQKGKFAEIIQYESLHNHFNEYNGNDRSYDETTDFIRDMFENVGNRIYSPHRQIFTHLIDDVTTGREEIHNKLWNDFQTIVINNSLAQGGLIA